MTPAADELFVDGMLLPVVDLTDDGDDVLVPLNDDDTPVLLVLLCLVTPLTVLVVLATVLDTCDAPAALPTAEEESATRRRLLLFFTLGLTAMTWQNDAPHRTAHASIQENCHPKGCHTNPKTVAIGTITTQPVSGQTEIKEQS